MHSTGDTTVAERLVSLETKLDILLQQINPKIEDHESRLRKVEAKLWLLAGACATGGGVVGGFLGPLLGGGA